MGNTFIRWHLYCFVLEQAHLPQHAEVLRGDLRSLPSGNFLPLHALAGTGGDVLAALGPGRHGDGAAERKRKEEAGRMRCSRRMEARAMAGENDLCGAVKGKNEHRGKPL